MPSFYDTVDSPNPTKVTDSQRKRVLRPSLDQSFDGGLFRRVLNVSNQTQKLTSEGTAFQTLLQCGGRGATSIADTRFTLDGPESQISYERLSSSDWVPHVRFAFSNQQVIHYVWNGSTLSETFRITPGSIDIRTNYIQMSEQSDPAAGGSNTARLYTRDNGAGKTQLVVRFPTGAIQVLATEP